jgi:2-methylcitrate dehydratase PrpD
MGMALSSETYGAAAIAGRLLGLTRDEMIRALGLVGRTEGFGGGIWDGSPTFKIGQGNFARSGIMAALLAKAGWSGALDPFFGSTGMGQNIPPESRYDHPELLTGLPDKKFYTETMFKPYLGGGPTQAPIHAALTLVKKHGFKAEDIEEAILRTSPGVATGLHYARPYKAGHYPTGDALFSYKYAVASGLARGTARNQDYMEEAVRDPIVQELIPKVTLALAELDNTVGIELEVKLKDGNVFTEYVARATGEPDYPLSREVLDNKFMEQVEFSGMISKENAQVIKDTVDNLEDVKNVAEIVKLTVKS